MDHHRHPRRTSRQRTRSAEHPTHSRHPSPSRTHHRHYQTTHTQLDRTRPPHHPQRTRLPRPRHPTCNTPQGVVPFTHLGMECAQTRCPSHSRRLAAGASPISRGACDMACTHHEWVCETTTFDPYDTYTCTRCWHQRQVDRSPNIEGG